MNKYFFSFLLVFFTSAPLFAEDAGQVINVNQSYQIAFVDIGNSVLKQGDIIKVLLGAEDSVYMQVLESSSILSKLGPVQTENFKTNYKDLQRISVGDRVVKVSQLSAAVGVPVPAVDTEEVERLQKELAQAKLEIKRLEEANKILEQSKKDVDPKAVPAQLKARLENMNRILNQN